MTTLVPSRRSVVAFAVAALFLLNASSCAAAATATTMMQQTAAEGSIRGSSASADALLSPVIADPAEHDQQQRRRSLIALNDMVCEPISTDAITTGDADGAVEVECRFRMMIPNNTIKITEKEVYEQCTTTTALQLFGGSNTNTACIKTQVIFNSGIDDDASSCCGVNNNDNNDNISNDNNNISIDDVEVTAPPPPPPQPPTNIDNDTTSTTTTTGVVEGSTNTISLTPPEGWNGVRNKITSPPVPVPVPTSQPTLLPTPPPTLTPPTSAPTLPPATLPPTALPPVPAVVVVANTDTAAAVVVCPTYKPGSGTQCNGWLPSGTTFMSCKYDDQQNQDTIICDCNETLWDCNSASEGDRVDSNPPPPPPSSSSSSSSSSVIDTNINTNANNSSPLPTVPSSNTLITKSMHCPGTEPTTGEACGTSTLLFHQCVYYDQFPEPTKFIDCRCNNQVYTCNIASEETYGKILSSF